MQTQAETRTITVTPEQAARWLERNTHNRPKRPAAIERYARDMAEVRLGPARWVRLRAWATRTDRRAPGGAEGGA